VYLGSIDLVVPYYRSPDSIIHMQLMSWAGDKVDERNVPTWVKEALGPCTRWCVKV
jgi:hypothetical protein